MAKKDFPLDIDLMKNELQNSSFHKLSTPPSNPVVGQFYFDTDDQIPYFWNGLLWRDFGGSTGVVESVTSTDNHIVINNTDPLNPVLSFQLVDNENLLTDDELEVVQSIEDDYLLKDTTLQTADTPEDTSLFSFWKIGVGRVKIAFSELITNVMHSQLRGLEWLTSGHTGTANTIAGFDENGSAKEYPTSKYYTKTLTVAGWSNKQQSVAVVGVTVDNTVYVSPSNARANYLAYGSSQISVISQSLDTLTFECTTVPTIELTVNIEVV